MPYAASGFWERIRRMARQPTWWAEVGIAFSLTLWASICAVEHHHLNHRSFHLLIRMAPEILWERMALAAGLFHVVALMINGRPPWLDGYHWRAAASFVSAWFLAFLMINFASARETPPGAAFYLVPLVIDLVAMIKNVRRTA